VSRLDHMFEPEPPSVRRLEVITGTGRRRRFSIEDKARILEETLAPGAVVSQVARRHGLTPQQVFTWRRQARQMRLASDERGTPKFVPAVVESSRAEAVSLPAPAAKSPKRRHAREPDGLCGVIEVSIAGVTVRVGRGADAKMLAAVIAALKAAT
jgi:transposase